MTVGEEIVAEYGGDKDLIDAIDRAIVEDRRGRKLSDEKLEGIRQFKPLVSLDDVNKLFSHIEFLNGLISDLKQESTAYEQGVQAERERIAEGVSELAINTDMNKMGMSSDKFVFESVKKIILRSS